MSYPESHDQPRTPARARMDAHDWALVVFAALAIPACCL